MQFLIIAKDGTDKEAPDRRMKVRKAHLEGVQKMRAQGEFIEGGAILDDAGKMIGSCMIVEFYSRETMEAWLRNDPYVTAGVWREINIHPFKIAITN